jgi:hypothetical protein
MTGSPSPTQRGKIVKGATERNIRAALNPGWRLTGINWKKRKVHVTNGCVVRVK